MGAPRNGDQAAAADRVPAPDIGSQRTETEVSETPGGADAPSRGGERETQEAQGKGREPGTETQETASFAGPSRPGQNQQRNAE